MFCPVPHEPMVPIALNPPVVDLLHVYARLIADWLDGAVPRVPEHHGHAHVQPFYIFCCELGTFLVPRK